MGRGSGLRGLAPKKQSSLPQAAEESQKYPSIAWMGMWKRTNLGNHSTNDSNGRWHLWTPTSSHTIVSFSWCVKLNLDFSTLLVLYRYLLSRAETQKNVSDFTLTLTHKHKCQPTKSGAESFSQLWPFHPPSLSSAHESPSRICISEAFEKTQWIYTWWAARKFSQPGKFTLKALMLFLKLVFKSLKSCCIKAKNINPMSFKITQRFRL